MILVGIFVRAKVLIATVVAIVVEILVFASTLIDITAGVVTLMIFVIVLVSKGSNIILRFCVATRTCVCRVALFRTGRSGCDGGVFMSRDIILATVITLMIGVVTVRALAQLSFAFITDVILGIGIIALLAYVALTVITEVILVVAVSVVAHALSTTISVTDMILGIDVRVSKGRTLFISGILAAIPLAGYVFMPSDL